MALLLFRPFRRQYADHVFDFQRSFNSSNRRHITRGFWARAWHRQTDGRRTAMLNPSYHRAGHNSTASTQQSVTVGRCMPLRFAAISSDGACNWLLWSEACTASHWHHASRQLFNFIVYMDAHFTNAAAACAYKQTNNCNSMKMPVCTVGFFCRWMQTYNFYKGTIYTAPRFFCCVHG